jgi:hypothetical protein
MIRYCRVQHGRLFDTTQNIYAFRDAMLHVGEVARADHYVSPAGKFNQASGGRGIRMQITEQQTGHELPRTGSRVHASHRKQAMNPNAATSGCLLQPSALAMNTTDIKAAVARNASGPPTAE